MENKLTIYLAGQVTVSAINSFNWRDTVQNYFKYQREFEFVDPTKDLYNRTLFENLKSKSNSVQMKSFNQRILERIGSFQVKGLGILPQRDRQRVAQSQICVVNLHRFDPDIPLVGTFFELAWFFETPEKPVIGIFDGNIDQDIVADHPFVKKVVTEYVTGPLEACELIERFY